MLSELERAIINRYQGGFPIARHPFATAAAELGTDEATLITTVEHLVTEGLLSRFGPMYNTEKLGGALTLAALHAPPAEFERISEQVNAFPEVAHNYERDHELNMWFVVATEDPDQVGEVLSGIEQQTGCKVFNFPKQQEFYIGLQFEV